MNQGARQKRSLSREKQQTIAFDVLSTQTVTETARKHQVTRHTVYSHQEKATKAINDAYSPADADVLFYLPVTKQFIAQIIVALLVICKASYRDSMQFIKDCFDYSVSLGHVCNTLDDANIHALIINDGYDLSPIKRAASDEIFHRNQPILATVDIPSRYCASLSKQKTRCQDAWGVELLDLQDKGFNPGTAVIDGAKGLKAGYEQALPKTSLLFDHFHIIQDAKELVRFLANTKNSTLSAVLKISGQLDKAKTDNVKKTLSIQHEQATVLSQEALKRYQDVNTLIEWFQFDVLQLASLPPKEREDLYDFIIEELQLRAEGQERIQQFLSSIIHQRKSLMIAICHLDTKLSAVADKHGIPLTIAWDIAFLARYDFNAVTYHTQSDNLEQKVGEKFDLIEDDILLAMDETDRTSCMVENFNSRLAPYLDERKGFKNDRFSLIQFGLNHRPFQRSERQTLKGKTPAQVMSGRDHPHWLEMLGFKRFQLAA